MGRKAGYAEGTEGCPGQGWAAALPLGVAPPRLPLLLQLSPWRQQLIETGQDALKILRPICIMDLCFKKRRERNASSGRTPPANTTWQKLAFLTTKLSYKKAGSLPLFLWLFDYKNNAGSLWKVREVRKGRTTLSYLATGRTWQ